MSLASSQFSSSGLVLQHISHCSMGRPCNHASHPLLGHPRSTGQHQPTTSAGQDTPVVTCFSRRSPCRAPAERTAWHTAWARCRRQRNDARAAMRHARRTCTPSPPSATDARGEARAWARALVHKKQKIVSDSRTHTMPSIDTHTTLTYAEPCASPGPSRANRTYTPTRPAHRRQTTRRRRS